MPPLKSVTKLRTNQGQSASEHRAQGCTASRGCTYTLWPSRLTAHAVIAEKMAVVSGDLVSLPPPPDTSIFHITVPPWELKQYLKKRCKHQ
jgi:hypothetical protein